jgi:hypothetical protein
MHTSYSVQCDVSSVIRLIAMPIVYICKILNTAYTEFVKYLYFVGVELSTLGY